MGLERGFLVLLASQTACSLLYRVDGHKGADVDDSIDSGADAAIPYAFELEWQEDHRQLLASVDVGPNDVPAIGAYFSGSVSIDGTDYSSSGGSDIFVGSLDPQSGDLIAGASYGGEGHEFATHVSVGLNNNVVVSGLLAGETTVGDDSFSAGTAAPYESFLASYQPSGEHLWSLYFRSDADNSTIAAVSVSAGPAYVCGS